VGWFALEKGDIVPLMLDLGSILTRERPKLRKMRRKERPKAKKQSIPTAELVECTCPEPCERDHETD
jgi:hypothetical protein